MSFDSATSADVKDAMSEEQRRLIISLHEQLDGVRPGSFAEYDLPRFRKYEASNEIDRLRAKLRSRS